LKKTACLKYSWLVAAALVAGYSVSLTSPASASTSTTTVTSDSLSSEVYTAAMAFYNTLDSSQQSTVQLAWSLDTARHWSNLPAQLVSRNGIQWSSLSSAQKKAATALIRTALSKKGAALQGGLMAADDYLKDNGGGSSYGRGNYYISFIGTPSTTDFWVLQITGHHLTWNLAFNGSVASPTPMFLGIEPKGEFTQNGKTYDPMQAQRTAFSNLGAALTAYSGAKLSGTYSDLLFGANGSGNIDGSCPRDYDSVTEHGLAYSSLSSADQALVKTAVKAYVATQANEYAKDLASAYLDSTALASTYVAYAGSGTVTTKGNYFRIEGPRVWIEFSVQSGVIFNTDIHYHTIWRDKTGDYGGACTS
jgi:hypothetical protein